jgi:hypothetical protein
MKGDHVMRHVLLAIMLIGGLAFAGCSAGGSASVTCTSTLTGHGVDTTNYQATCTVSGASSPDSSFDLTANLHIGQGNSIASTFAFCHGTLSYGSGACTGAYTVVIPLTRSIILTGVTHPSGATIQSYTLFQTSNG